MDEILQQLTVMNETMLQIARNQEAILDKVKSIRGEGRNQSSINDVCERLETIDSSLSCIDTSVSLLSD